MRYLYYFLPLNFYMKPAGWVEVAYLTDEEAQVWRNAGHYLFKDLEEATRQVIALGG